jgi:uncharacterized RDD family membrane protein YckC
VNGGPAHEVEAEGRADAQDRIGDGTKRRLFAASADNLLAMLLASVLMSHVTAGSESAQLALAVFIYLAYFGVQEGACSTTFGKWAFGLRIVRLDGTACGWRRAIVRTLMRLLEVNPVLLGGLPAGLAVAFSKRRQRLGDRLCGTLVVRRRAAATGAQNGTREI